MILCNYCSSACSNNIFVCFTGFFDIVFVIQNKGNHHFPSSCDSAVTYIYTNYLKVVDLQCGLLNCCLIALLVSHDSFPQKPIISPTFLQSRC